MMKTTWLLVANASEARLFTLTGKNDLKLIKEFTHPQSRLKDTEITSDRSGYFEKMSAGFGGNFMEPTDPKKYEADTFARELANELESGRVSHYYEALILIASPQFYGMLNKHLSNNVGNLVSTHIAKDYTKDRDRQLVSRIESYL